MTSQNLKVAVEDGIATVTIDRPPVNALNSQTLEELDALMSELEGNEQVRVIILTGGGQRAFVAGADINEILKSTTAEAGEAFIKRGQGVFNKIEGLSKPVIAAVSGFCLGGGMELALACHIRLAGERARFGLPEINLGVMPGWGGTQRMPRLVGLGRAYEMILTGDMITADEAYRIGLANRVVSDGSVVDAAKELAKKIAAKGRVAVQLALHSVDIGKDMSLDEGLTVEMNDFVRVIQTEDAGEGLKAFVENRPPKFQDK